MNKYSLTINMWYGDARESADKIDVSFCPENGPYRGNIWENGKAIGDYVCSDSALLEDTFRWLYFNWN